MRNIHKVIMLSTIAMALLSTEVVAQDESQKVRIKIKKEINGELTTIEKTYNSLEEMKNDPVLKDMNVKIMDGRSFFFTNGGEGHIEINVDKTENSTNNTSVFFFKNEDEDTVWEWENTEHDVEVVKVEDGKVKVILNGELIDTKGNVIIRKIDEGDIGDIKDIRIEKQEDGSKVVIINEEEIDLESSENGDKVEVLVNKFELSDNGQSEHSIEIIVKKQVRIEDLANDDESMQSLDLESRKELKLDQLSYYPNPSEGLFRLDFQAKSVPTEIMVIDLTGHIVFQQSLNDFTGRYSQNIDLSDQPKGVYIMQVIQGKRALNKKIVIE